MPAETFCAHIEAYLRLMQEHLSFARVDDDPTAFTLTCHTCQRQVEFHAVPPAERRLC